MNLKRISWLAVSIAALVACGSKKDGGSDKPAGVVKEGHGIAEAPAVVTGESLFTGSTVTLPTPAAKLHFGMTEAEAKAAAPEVFKDKYGYAVPNTRGKGQYSDIKIATQIDQDRLWNIRIELLDSQDAAKAYLTKKWGEPIASKNSIGTPEYYWNAPDAGLRAKLEQKATESIVYFSAMIKRDALLGTDPKHFGFDTLPLVGATADDATKALAPFSKLPPVADPNDPSRLTMAFLPTENELEYSGTISLRLKDGKVVGYTLGYGSNPKDTEALVAKLESVYGKGKPSDPNMYTDYPGPVPVTAEIRHDAGFSNTVWVGVTTKAP
jgi:hypothetical protein